MPIRRATPFTLGAGFFLSAAGLALVGACSNSNSTPAPPPGGDGSATCASPGQATPGPADTHCQGVPPQPVSEASCFVDAGPTAEAGSGDDGSVATDGAVAGDGGAGQNDAGPSDQCAYGATLFGREGRDDDCKYQVSWTSDPICESTGGVQFTVTVKSNVDGSPVTGIPDGIIIEAFIPTSLDAACDDRSTHPSPGTANLVETPAGSGVYKGPIVFDAPGEWTVRFHIHEECADLFDTSPHGHVAFHVTVP